MSPEFKAITTGLQPFAMTPQLAHAANKVYGEVVSTADKLNDVLESSVPEEIAEELIHRVANTFVSDEGIARVGDAQLLTGFRFIGLLVGKDTLENVEEDYNQGTFDHTLYVAAQRLNAANIVRKLQNGDTSADSIRGVIQTFVNDIPSPDTQLPTAYQGMTLLTGLLPYLLVSRTEIKPSEVMQYATTLQNGLKNNLTKHRLQYSGLVKKVMSELRSSQDPVYGARLMREELLRLAPRAEAANFITGYYTLPASDDLVRTLSNLRSVERDKREVTAELAFMTNLATQLDSLPSPEFESTPPEKLSLMSLDDLPVHMRVEWEVLPPGSNIMDVAHSIVKEKQQRTKKPFGIDLSRLQALESIRQLVGENNSKYVRGSLKERGIVRDGGEECPDEYILLLINGPNGDVSSVVADSPIVGPHAMYVYRNDTAQKGSEWSTVFRLDKPDARRLGARAVKHSVPVGGNLIETMTNKAMELLTCRPEDFSKIQFNGNKAARIKKLSQMLISAESER